MVKKLRYYARFIVVCLLLKKMKFVRELVRVSSLVSYFYKSLYFILFMVCVVISICIACIIDFLANYHVKIYFMLIDMYLYS